MAGIFNPMPAVSCEAPYGVARHTAFPTGNGQLRWSSTTYLILPLFLWMLRKSKLLPISLILAAIALRFVIHNERGEIQTLAFGSIIGRIDQFALGMLVYQFRSNVRQASCSCHCGRRGIRNVSLAF